jgi:4-diphosphocytidyl-2-C-methyl-D-erythritol kinase
MILFPNAKINLGLHVTGRRADGFHNIETLFYPIGLSDIIEITPLSGKGLDNSFVNTGIAIDTGNSDNLCVRAWKVINKIGPLPNVAIHLHKIIPAGAGLGGGSSDAAFVLMALNSMFDLGLKVNELAATAGSIGSDCPFFIFNKPLVARGTGDIFEPSDVDLSGKFIMVVHPGIMISTAMAYRNICISEHHLSVKQVTETEPSEWQDSLINDFEPWVFKTYPVIANIKEKMIVSGAFYASMSGSGSAVYGLFDSNEDFSAIKKEFPGMFIWAGKI